MSAKTVTFETGHEEMIHDAQYDYYGKRLATCSSDRSIRIFQISSDRQDLLATIKGAHEGPIYQLSWAHPKFGAVLASASYDGRVCVWKEQQANVWVQIYQYNRNDSAITSVQFAPHTFGLILACGSTDGSVSILTRQPNNTWEPVVFNAHKGGVNAVSWGPDVKSGALLSQTNQNQQGQQTVNFEKKILTAGCDNRIRIWKCNDQTGGWEEVNQWANDDNSHGDWVRDAAWAPSLGLPSNTIASASEDKTVIIWTEDANGVWSKSKVLQFDTKCWKVSWSLMGNILAVSQGDNQVSLWKESLDGDWKNLSQQQANQIIQQQSAASSSQQYQQHADSNGVAASF